MSINPDAHFTREIELTHWGESLTSYQLGIFAMSHGSAQRILFSPLATASPSGEPSAAATSACD
jgi:hypothetical protein